LGKVLQLANGEKLIDDLEFHVSSFFILRFHLLFAATMLRP
jgi:hypothetical protein